LYSALLPGLHPQNVPNGVPSVLSPRLTAPDLAQPGPRRGLLLCILHVLLLGCLDLPGSSLGGSPGGLLLRSLGGLLPRSSGSFPLILAVGPLLRLALVPVGLLLILTAGLSLYRQVPAEWPPAIPVRGTADMFQLCLVAGDMLQLSLITVASPARTRPMPDDDAMGPPD
jgi:hypothetical protein